MRSAFFRTTLEEPPVVSRCRRRLRRGEFRRNSLIVERGVRSSVADVRDELPPHALERRQSRDVEEEANRSERLAFGARKRGTTVNSRTPPAAWWRTISRRRSPRSRAASNVSITDDRGRSSNSGAPRIVMLARTASAGLCCRDHPVYLRRPREALVLPSSIVSRSRFSGGEILDSIDSARRHANGVSGRELLAADLIDPPLSPRAGGGEVISRMFEPCAPTSRARRRALGGDWLLFDITRLTALESVRREFVSDVSHELRTPLSTNQEFSSKLSSAEPSSTTPRTYRRCLRDRPKNADRMEAILDDLTDLSAIERAPSIW